MIVTPNQTDNFLNQWDARWKLISLLLCIFAIAALQTLFSISLALLGSFLLVLLSGVSIQTAVSRLGLLWILFIPCFLILPWQLDGSAPEKFHIHLSLSGFLLALTLYLRAAAIVCVSMSLLATTPFTLILHAAQNLRFPKLFVQITLLAYRYLFSLTHELKSARKALVTRGFQNRFSMRTFRSLAHVIGMIMVRSFEKTERIYHAMLCRGYRGMIPGRYAFKTTKKDPILSMACLVWITLLLLIDTNQ